MASIGIRELKRDTSGIVRRVRERGETIDVTHRGRVVARLVPVSAEPRSRQDRKVLQDIETLATEIGARWPKGVTATSALDRGRGG